jgi:hypothetical protein
MAELAATRKLTLVKSEAARVEYQYFGALRIRVDVIDAVDIDPNIFLYRQDMATPYTPDASPTNTFFSVASPADINDYPIGAPDPLKAFPFFRQTFVELDFRSTLQADQFWQDVIQEATVLIHAMNKLELLEEVDHIQIGPFPKDDDEPSGSESIVSSPP